MQLEIQRQQLLQDRQQFHKDQLKAQEMRNLQSPTLAPQTPLQLPPLTVKTPLATPKESMEFSQFMNQPVSSATYSIQPPTTIPSQPVPQSKPHKFTENASVGHSEAPEQAVAKVDITSVDDTSKSLELEVGPHFLAEGNIEKEKFHEEEQLPSEGKVRTSSN